MTTAPQPPSQTPLTEMVRQEFARLNTAIADQQRELAEARRLLGECGSSLWSAEKYLSERDWSSNKVLMTDGQEVTPPHMCEITMAQVRTFLARTEGRS